jgi:hypothetical protein
MTSTDHDCPPDTLTLELQRLEAASEPAQLASALEAVHAALGAHFRRWLGHHALAADTAPWPRLLALMAEHAPLHDGVGDLLHAAQRFECVRERFTRTRVFAADKAELVRYAQRVARSLASGIPAPVPAPVQRSPELRVDTNLWTMPLAWLVITPPLLIAASAFAVSLAWLTLLGQDYVSSPSLVAPSIGLSALLAAICCVLAADLDLSALWTRLAGGRPAPHSAPRATRSPTV